MLETMKRNKILTYAFLMAIPMTTGNIFSSCTDDFEKLNTSNIQVDPADLPFAAQCTEPMTYCYPPQQNMFQFWTNLTIDLYGGYFMTPNGNFTNGDMGENRGHSGGMYENYYLHIFNNTRRIIAQCDASGNGTISKSEGDKWIDLLNSYNISWVCWNLSNKNETSAILNSNCNKTTGFQESDFSQQGKWLLKKLE